MNTVSECQVPTGINHIVLNVRDIEESHRFWTECLGFRHVGTSRPRGEESAQRPPMRFYSGVQESRLHHHDIALIEQPGLTGESMHPLNHVAIAYPTGEAWEKQVSFLIARGARLSRRVDRGVTRSISVTDPNGYEVELVHELPREAWEADIDAALNRAVERPIGA